MNNRTSTSPLIGSSLAVALALAIWSPAPARSAEPAEPKGMTETGMMERCKTMKEQKQKMKDDMKAQDARLTEQLATMNRAPDDEKVDLMAAVLTHVVEHRIVMDARKAAMEEEMMKHMMQHGQMGKDSMAQCPMMQATDDKAAGAHEAHQDKKK